MVVLTLLMVILMVLMMTISLKSEGSDGMMEVYECGFNPISVVRMGFSYSFFLIAILFLVFDVEIMLMLVWPYSNGGNGMLVGVIFFLILLGGGWWYEASIGSIAWVG